MGDQDINAPIRKYRSQQTVVNWGSREEHQSTQVSPGQTGEEAGEDWGRPGEDGETERVQRAESRWERQKEQNNVGVHEKHDWGVA